MKPLSRSFGRAMLTLNLEMQNWVGGLFLLLPRLTPLCFPQRISDGEPANQLFIVSRVANYRPARVLLVIDLLGQILGIWVTVLTVLTVLTALTFLITALSYLFFRVPKARAGPFSWILPLRPRIGGVGSSSC
jgi:hypothetical protein